MSWVARNALFGFVSRFAQRLRYPQLFLITVGVTLLDVLIPDAIPFVDEILLVLLTMALGSLKRKRDPDAIDAEWREEK